MASADSHWSLFRSKAMSCDKQRSLYWLAMAKRLILLAGWTAPTDIRSATLRPHRRLPLISLHLNIVQQQISNTTILVFNKEQTQQMTNK